MVATLWGDYDNRDSNDDYLGLSHHKFSILYSLMSHDMSLHSPKPFSTSWWRSVLSRPAPIGRPFPIRMEGAKTAPAVSTPAAMASSHDTIESETDAGRAREGARNGRHAATAQPRHDEIAPMIYDCSQ